LGTTTTLYQPMSQDEIDRVNRRRWRRHRIDALPAGVSVVHEGRSGSFYVRTGDIAIELEAELAGAPNLDVLINSEGFSWQIDVHKLERIPAPPELAVRAKHDLEAWLAEKRWRYEYFPKPSADGR
jgi:hypothetical protein